MKNKTVVVTGASSGIGFETALALAKMGARTILICRSEEKGSDSMKRIISESGNSSVELILADFTSFSSVRKAATEFNRRSQKLDVLVNNAGGVYGKRVLTTDGLEWNFAVNYLAPFLLTNLLLPALKNATEARIVTVSSAAHKMGHIRFEDLMGEKKFTQAKAYAQAKLGNALFAFELARRLKDTGITSNGLHPGVVGTHFANKGSWAWKLFFGKFSFLLKTPEQGAQTSVYLASSPEVKGVTGKYFSDCKISESSSDSKDEVLAKKLWEVSEKLVGLS